MTLCFWRPMYFYVGTPEEDLKEDLKLFGVALAKAIFLIAKVSLMALIMLISLITGGGLQGLDEIFGGDSGSDENIDEL